MITNLINSIIEFINSKTDVIQTHRVVEIVGATALILFIIIAIIAVGVLIWVIIGMFCGKWE